MPYQPKCALDSAKPAATIVDATTDDSPPDWAKVLRWSVLGGCAVCLLLALTVFSWVEAIVASIVVVAVVQGLWRGVSDIAGLLIGTLVALLSASPIGMALQGVTSAVLGTTGITNRIVAVAIAGLVILLVVAVPVSILIRRLLHSRPRWKQLDPFAGAAVGAAEGMLLALALMWVPVALKPLAQAQVADTGVPVPAAPLLGSRGSGEQGRGTGSITANSDSFAGTGSNPAAEFVVHAAEAIDASVFSDIAVVTNPVSGSRLMSVTADAIEVLQHEGMRERFLGSNVMKQINSSERVRRALEILQADPELVLLMEPDQPMGDAVRAMFSSETVIRALDETGVIEELTPLAPQIAEAIQEAKRNPAAIPSAPAPRPSPGSNQSEAGRGGGR